MKAEASSKVKIQRIEGLIFVSFAVTVIDKRNLGLLSDELDEILRDPNPQTVEIDLSGVRKIDALGMAFVQAMLESIKDVGGKVTLRGLADQFKRAANGTRVASFMDDRRSVRRPPLGTYW